MTPVLVLLFVAPLLLKAKANPVTPKPLDCNDIFYHNRTMLSGVYLIYPSDPRFAIPVYCDVETEGGPWTVIVRRFDGSANFVQPWDTYVKGFGDVNGEYWLGLEFIHKITANRKQKLRVEMTDFEGGQAFATYSSFSVGANCDGYKLSVSGFSNEGGAGDSLLWHNHMKFTTFDRDQDTWVHNCAKSYSGGFWFRSCHYSNPNGAYLWGGHANGAPHGYGILWNSWRKAPYSLKSITFMLHPA